MEHHGLLERDSAQVYRRQGQGRLCIAAAEPAAGLRDNVPVGSILTMNAGSAAQVLTAWQPLADQRNCNRSNMPRDTPRPLLLR